MRTARQRVIEMEKRFVRRDGNAVWCHSTAVDLAPDDGVFSVAGKIRDKDLGETEYTDSVTVDNIAQQDKGEVIDQLTAMLPTVLVPAFLLAVLTLVFKPIVFAALLGRAGEEDARAREVDSRRGVLVACGGRFVDAHRQHLAAALPNLIDA